MQLKSLDDCSRYVEAELDRTVRRLPGWVATATDVLEWHGPGPMRSLSSGVQAWRVAPADGRGWYRLDAALHEQEFIIWFGHRQAGIESLQWIMCPALHVTFDDLAPTQSISLTFGIGDVLQAMIASAGSPYPVFPLNGFSVD